MKAHQLLTQSNREEKCSSAHLDSEVSQQMGFRDFPAYYFPELQSDIAKVVQNNFYLTRGKIGREDVIEFPPIDCIQKPAICELLSVNDWKKIGAFSIASSIKQKLIPNELIDKKLYPKIIEALLEKIIQQLNKRISQSHGKRARVTEAIGTFYRDFISIHPFEDGNGRLGRLLVEKLLHEQSIHSPIWKEFGEDIELTEVKFVHMLQDSIGYSEIFHQSACDSLGDINQVDISFLFETKPTKKIKLMDFLSWARHVSNGEVSQARSIHEASASLTRAQENIHLEVDKTDTGLHFKRRIQHLQDLYSEFLMRQDGH